MLNRGATIMISLFTIMALAENCHSVETQKETEPIQEITETGSSHSNATGQNSSVFQVISSHLSILNQQVNCTENKRLYPDDPKLLSQREFMRDDEDFKPQLFDVFIYIDLVHEVLNPEISTEVILNQLGVDLYCSMSSAKAKEWLPLVQKAEKAYPPYLEMKTSISQIKEEDPVFQKILESIQVFAEKLRQNGIDFDPDLMFTQHLIDIMTDYVEKHGQEMTLEELRKMEEVFKSHGWNDESLKILRSFSVAFDPDSSFSQLGQVCTEIEPFLTSERPLVQLWARLIEDIAKQRLAAKEEQIFKDDQKLLSLSTKPTPDFSIEISDGDRVGESFKLSDLKGKVVVLSFWQSWCGTCVKELKSLEEFYQKNKEQGVVFLALSELNEEQPRDDILYMRKKHGVHYPQVFVLEQIKNDYGINGLPTMILIGKDGSIKKILSGNHVENLETEVQKLIKEK